MRRRKSRDQRDQLARLGVASDAPKGAQPAVNADGKSGGKIRRWREREKPEPSIVWQTVAIIALTSALATGIAALTVSPGAAVSPLVFGIASGVLLIYSATCFLAHWDSNRGRKSKEYEREELLSDE